MHAGDVQLINRKYVYQSLLVCTKYIPHSPWCAGHPRSSHRQTFARTEIAGYWGPGRPARDIHGYLICCGTALQPLHQPGTVKQSSLVQGWVHVNKPLFAEQTLFNMQSNACSVPLTLYIFGDDQLTTMTLQICLNHIAVNLKSSDHVKFMILQKFELYFLIFPLS